MTPLFSFNPVTIPVFLAFVVCVLASASAAGKGNGKGELYFSFSMAAAAVYALFYFWEINVPTLESKAWMLKFQYLGAVFIAPFFWLFAKRFVSSTPLPPWLNAAVLVLPFFHLICAFSNDYHSLLFDDARLAFGDANFSVVFKYSDGPIYWTHSAYSGIFVF